MDLKYRFKYFSSKSNCTKYEGSKPRMRDCMRGYEDKVNHPIRSTLDGKKVKIVKACSNPKCPEKRLYIEDTFKRR